ncbi:MAG: hypothetical protein O2931_11780 [Planctomycetota bacterium]|nr:hypothetical protein [Planctomycetota bacterium]
MNLRATLGSTIVGMQLVLASLVGLRGMSKGASAYGGYSLSAIVCGAFLLAAVGGGSLWVVMNSRADQADGSSSRLLSWMNRLAALFVLLGLGFARVPIALWLVVGLFFLGADFLGHWLRNSSVAEGIGQQSLTPDVTPQHKIDAEVMVEDEELHESTEEMPESFFEESMDQRITRSMKTPDGDVLHAVVRCRFFPHQRNGTVHIGFCPPFRAIPEITVRAIDGPDAGVTMSETLAWGARIDIRLHQDLPDPSSCVFEVLAHVASVSSN